MSEWDIARERDFRSMGASVERARIAAALRERSDLMAEEADSHGMPPAAGAALRCQAHSLHLAANDIESGRL